MGSIDKRKSGKWRARWYEEDGRERAKHFDRKIDAQRHLATVEVSKLNGTYIDPSAGKTLFRDYAEQWQSMQVYKDSTRLQVEGNMRLHVYPFIGDRRIASVRPSEVQAWVSGRAQALAPGTVELVYRYVVSVFLAATRDRLIVASPCVGIKLPKQKKKKVVPPETEQVFALAEALPDRYRALVWLAAGTGLRQGECFGLTVDRVDFLRKTLTVDRQLQLLPGSRPSLVPPKTTASYRNVPLPAVVVDELAAHIAAYPSVDGFIFTDENGSPIKRNRFSDLWRVAVRDSKMVSGTRFHDLRHYYASLLIRHGESVKVVQSRLGHASASETLDTYSHLWPDSEDRTRLAVDEILSVRLAALRLGY